MKKQHLLTVVTNFLAVVLLASLFLTPLYFAKNFAKVAGVKSTPPYLLVSQVEKFPNLTFSQEADNYLISFTKHGPSQAYLDILVINNPTTISQTYTLRVISGQAKLFFGNDLASQLTTIAIYNSISIPISLYSSPEDLASGQTVKFRIIAE